MSQVSSAAGTVALNARIASLFSARLMRLPLGAIMLLLLFLPSAARATTYNWDITAGNGVIDDGDGVWSTIDANWTADGGATNVVWPNNTTDIAAFGGPSSTVGGNVTLSESLSAGGILFNGTDSGNYTIASSGGAALMLGSGGITVDSGAGAETLDPTLSITLAAAQSWTNNSANLLAVGGSVDAGANILTVGGSGNTTISGTFGFGTASSTGGIIKTGAGTLDLTGLVNFGSPTAATGNLTVKAGTLTLDGGANSGTIGSFLISVGDAAGDNGTFRVTSGTYTLTGRNSFVIGNFGNGAYVQTGGTVIQEMQYETNLGNNTGTVGSFTISGGLYSQQDTTNAYFYVGTRSTGILTVSGTGVLDAEHGVEVGRLGGTAAGGTINLDGGTLQTTLINAGGGTGTKTINFDGGTLKALASNAPFISGMTSANVLAGGAIIDTNGYNDTISQALVSGASPDGGLTKLGAGTLTLSAVNTYTGPTTISAGTLRLGDGTTNNGSVAGDIVNNGALVFANPMPLVYGGTISGSGTLVKNGAGALSLTADNSGFSGSVTINAGALLAANAAGSALGTGGVTIQTGGSLGGSGFVGSGASPAAIATVSNGSDATSNGHIAPGFGLTGTMAATLTINGSLALDANSYLDYRLGSDTTAGGGVNDLALVSGALTLPASGTLDANITAIGGSLAVGDYQLIGAGSIPAPPGSLSSSIVNVTGDSLSAIHTYSLGVVGNALDLIVSSNALTWTGVPGGGGPGGTGTAGVWDVGTSNNWSDPNHSAADFTNGMAVLFGDTYTVAAGNSSATPSATVMVQTGGIQPGLVVFNNSTSGPSYVVSNVGNDTSGASGISGSAAVSITGGGTVTLAGQNTYFGGTTLTSGTLNIDNAQSLGAGSSTFRINGGTIDNTSGGAITLVNNNPITLGGSFAYGGTQPLNLGTGAVTANPASLTITLDGTASALALGGVVTNASNAAQTLTVAGAGNTLTIGGYALSNQRHELREHDRRRRQSHHRRPGNQRGRFDRQRPDLCRQRRPDNQRHGQLWRRDNRQQRHGKTCRLGQPERQHDRQRRRSDGHRTDHQSRRRQSDGQRRHVSA